MWNVLPAIQCDNSIITDFNKARAELRARLVNTQKNEDILFNVPHREFLDLSIVYVLEVNAGCGELSGSICVTNEHMKLWGVDENDLYNQVKENRYSKDEGCIESMYDILCNMAKPEICEFMSPNVPDIYVITNKKKVNGAVEIINEKALKRFADMVKKDIVVIPSSVHECILIPIDGTQQNMDTLQRMVSEVNNTQLDEEDILSYHVYKYERVSGQITIAA